MCKGVGRNRSCTARKMKEECEAYLADPSNELATITSVKDIQLLHLTSGLTTKKAIGNCNGRDGKKKERE